MRCSISHQAHLEATTIRGTPTNGRLRRRKEKFNLSYRTMGRELGVSAQSINHWVNGRGPVPLSVNKLIWALDCIELLQEKLARAKERNEVLKDRIERLLRRRELAELNRLGADLARRAVSEPAP
jgi:transcriptional regulator with XRE-family HTH domain